MLSEILELQQLRDLKELKPSQYAKLNSLSTGYVRRMCNEGRVKGAHRIFRYWVIPQNAVIVKKEDASLPIVINGGRLESHKVKYGDKTVEVLRPGKKHDS